MLKPLLTLTILIICSLMACSPSNSPKTPDNSPELALPNENKQINTNHQKQSQPPNNPINSMKITQLNLDSNTRQNLQNILKKNNQSTEITDYATQIAHYYILSFKETTPQVLDTTIKSHLAIIDTKTHTLLPQNDDTLLTLLKPLDLFNNKDITDDDLLKLCSQILFNNTLLVDILDLIPNATEPTIEKNNETIIITADKKIDNGMQKPTYSKCTIKITPDKISHNCEEPRYL